MTCPATLRTLTCQRADAHEPYRGCMYVSTDVDDHHTRTDSEVE